LKEQLVQGLVNYSEWPKVAGVVIKALYSKDCFNPEHMLICIKRNQCPVLLPGRFIPPPTGATASSQPPKPNLRHNQICDTTHKLPLQHLVIERLAFVAAAQQ